MEFIDSETQRLLRTTARAYLDDAFEPDRLYRLESGKERIGVADVAALADLGWFGLLVPESMGGAGAGLLDAAVVVEELGYAAAPTPVPIGNVAAELLATASDVADHAADLASGRRLYTVSEGARRLGTRGAMGLTSANGKASGTLPLVPFAELATFVASPVAIDGEAGFALVELAGAEIKAAPQMDRQCYATVSFHDANATIIAAGDEAIDLHDRCDALLTAFATIEMAGMIRRVVEMTAEHITTRIQFGQPIGKFQAARHRAAELLTQAETTRWAAYDALWRFERDPTDTEAIWLAKHWAARASDRVFQNAHILHGGVGVGTEHPLHLYTQGIASLAVRGGAMNELVSRILVTLAVSGEAAG